MYFPFNIYGNRAVYVYVFKYIFSQFGSTLLIKGTSKKSKKIQPKQNPNESNSTMVVSNFSEDLRIDPNSNMPMDNILRTVGEKGPKLWLLKLVSVTFYQTFNFFSK